MLEWPLVGLGEPRASRFLAAIDGWRIYLDLPAGRGADRASMQGKILYADAEGGQLTEAADISLNLLRQCGEFVIDTFEISNRQLLHPAQ